MMDTASLSSSQNQSLLSDAINPKERSAYHLDRARRLIFIGSSTSLELERALIETSKAISFIADESKYYMFMAKLYKLGLDVSSAIFCYRYALKLDPNNDMAAKFLCEMLLLRGKELMMSGATSSSVYKFLSARYCFEEYLNRNKDSGEVWFLKAVCHIRAKEIAEAFDCANRAIKSNPNLSSEVYILRAKLLWSKGLIEQGNADIRIASAMDPDHPEVISFCQRSYKKAERLYQNCVLEFTKGDYTAALSSVRHALSITTDDVKLHVMIAKIYRITGDLQNAYSSILKAQEIFERASSEAYSVDLPSDIIRQMNLILNEVSIKYASEGEYEKAILLLNRIIKIERDIARGGLLAIDHRYFLNRGDCYRGLSQLFDAIFDYEYALELEPDNWEIRTRLSLAHYLLAVEQYNGAHFKQAENHLDCAIRFNPKVAGYYALRGKSSYYTYDFPKACQDFRKSLQLDGNNEDIRIRLAQFEVPDETVTSEDASDMLLDQFGKKLPPGTVKVTSADMVNMMLNPIPTRKLPVIQIKSLPHSTGSRSVAKTKIVPCKSASTTTTSTSNNGLILLNSSPKVNALTSSLLLPSTSRMVVEQFQHLNLSAHFPRTYVASNIVQEKQATVKKVFDKRSLHSKSKNEMWSVMATAGKMAFSRSHPRRHENPSIGGDANKKKDS